MPTNLFTPRRKIKPKIYAYSDTNFPGCLKVGYTTLTVRKRVAQQYPVQLPRIPYQILLDEPAFKDDGSTFDDHLVHRVLEKNGVTRKNGEWFECNLGDVEDAINRIKANQEFDLPRTQNFKMRPEQREAVEKTKRYFEYVKKNEKGRTPHFLWNAKMRFGKTFAAYQLAKQMDWKKVLILTFKPAVQDAWETDLNSHVDFDGWQFICKDKTTRELTPNPRTLKGKKIVCFGSFQDFLGESPAGGIKPTNEWVHEVNWDCVIFDEYHFGAWRDTAKSLTNAEAGKTLPPDQAAALQEYEEDIKDTGQDYFDESLMPITTDHYLYLSGTPFRAIATGEFIEDQIYNWTYSDEQREKENWDNKNGKNPYAALPRIVMMTYQLPEAISKIALKGEFNEFDLNEFFAADGAGQNAKFKHENEVQKWLDLIRGEISDQTLKLGKNAPVMPFSHTELLPLLTHTLWFLPRVASCQAMKNLLAERHNIFYQDYTVVVAAGSEAGMGVEALAPVHAAIGDDPLNTKTITLSCGKLTTGVSIPPWSGIFMLRNTSAPETYFQSAFRVQTPWTIKNPDGQSPNEETILKENCYIFDFALNRALKLVADYSCKLNVGAESAEQKVGEFIKFLPIIASDGSAMLEVDAKGVLDLAMSGTTATLLAKRWMSPLLVNVDNETLQRVLANPDAEAAIMKIEGFRKLDSDIIKAVVAKAQEIKGLKTKDGDKPLPKKDKGELTAAEKEYKSKRKLIQEKLIKFVALVPVFMYLSDAREQALQDVITQLEPKLFTKVTALTIGDFELLVKIGVFNSDVMNDAIWKFKRYEDPSLLYLGVDTHAVDARVGGFDQTLSQAEYARR